MKTDELLVEATKAKLNEVISILETSNLSKSHILKIIKSASNEVVEEIKNEMWQDVLTEGYKNK